MSEPQKPDNSIGCLIVWVYLMIVSCALAPVFEMLLKDAMK